MQDLRASHPGIDPNDDDLAMQQVQADMKRTREEVERTTRNDAARH
jgi:hypothetical protein